MISKVPELVNLSSVRVSKVPDRLQTKLRNAHPHGKKHQKKHEHNGRRIIFYDNILTPPVGQEHLYSKKDQNEWPQVQNKSVSDHRHKKTQQKQSSKYDQQYATGKTSHSPHSHGFTSSSCCSALLSKVSCSSNSRFLQSISQIPIPTSKSPMMS